jgi:glc operon protein GlcG
MELPTKKMLTLEAARAAMQASEATAVKNGWKVVICIVDDGGHLVMLQRLDGTQWSSIETALGKARAAVGWKRPSRVLEEMVNNGRYGFLSVPGPFTFLQGALPLEAGGTVVGAIGVSGVKAADDEIVAAAGVAAFSA